MYSKVCLFYFEELNYMCTYTFTMYLKRMALLADLMFSHVVPICLYPPGILGDTLGISGTLTALDKVAEAAVAVNQQIY